MKSTTRIFVAFAATAIVAVSAFAQLSQQNRDWARSPEAFLLTAEEQQKWKQVKTDADAQKFIDLFWARRDPTPATPLNEFREAFTQRVAYADQQFGQGRKRGAITDRGRMFIVLGSPTQIQRTNNQPVGTTQTPTAPADQRPETIQAYSPKQMWLYDQSKVTINLGAPNAKIAFVDQYSTNEWTLERGGGTDVADLTKRVNQGYVISPNLTDVPKYAKQTAPPAVPTPQALPAATAPAATAPAATAGAFKTESLKTAVTEFKAAKANPFKPISVYFTELVSPAGAYFVPVQLYIPKSAELSAPAMTTFFGVVEDAEGNQVAVFEEPATVATSNGDLYFDKSLMLKPGKYTATLGLAGPDGKPVVLSTAPMELRAIETDKSGISRLVVATDVHQTETAAPPGAPYAFGRVKIVPKGDRIITNKDEMTYFVEVINPGIDDATNLPKLQVKLDLVGAPDKSGKPPRTISAPTSDAAALPLSGAAGPGQYAILASIPLGEMKNPLPPGDYTLRLKVFDQVKKESWTAEQPLKIISAPAATAAASTK